MATSSHLLLLLVAAALLASAAVPASLAAGEGGCARDKKVTVQNLCRKPLTLTLEPVANSPHLFQGAAYTLQPNSHAEFPVCWWTGRLHAPGAVAADFHVGVDGGSYYRAPGAQQGQEVTVSITPHGSPLQGHCPAVGCAVSGCSRHEVPGGQCHNVQEIKIIYCSPHV